MRAVLAALAVLLASCGSAGKRHSIRVGSKNFTEQVVLGEIVAQHLEHKLGAPVERRLNLGGTLLAHEALRNHEIDVYPEYTGTALAAVLKAPLEGGPAEVLARVRAGYARDFQIDWLDPLGIDDSFAMVIPGAEARTRNLSSLTDAARTGRAWVLGVGYEFEQRTDGLAALNKAYALRWQGQPKTMDLGLLYKAMEEGQVTMIAANATDGLLSKMDLKVLDDDKHAFPPYQACLAAREDSLREVPGLRSALTELSGKFSNHIMQELNYQVDGRKRPVAEVAADFLKQAGLD